ncbi:MAG: hypothetical protein HOW97_33750 [Catenulispora sp.]|nr:hypothetical protein [Catenulispora sp.]
MSATASARAVARRRARPIRVLLTLFALIAGTVLAFMPAKPAHAALPDVWGYGYHDPSAPAPGPLANTLTSVGTAGQIVSAGGNSYAVLFPNVGAPQGIVHVTAIAKTGNPTPQPPSWCEPDGWSPSGPDEIIKVSCWVVAGGVAKPFPSGFAITWVSATYTGPPAADYAYAESDGLGGLITQFDSAGAGLSPAHLGTGVYQIKLPGVGPTGSTLGGDLQVTGQAALSGVPARCKIGAWMNAGGIQLPTILCFDGGTGAPVDARWSLTYQFKLDVRGMPASAWGYFWQTTGAPPLTNLDSATGWTTVTSGSVPPAGIAVAFPAIGPSATPFSTATITAFGGGPGFCRLGALGGGPPWLNSGGSLLIRSVDCFNGGGVPAASDFFATYTAK